MPAAADIVRDLLRRAPAGAPAFLCVGLAGLALDTAVFSLLHAAGLSTPLARALSLAAATILTWSLNRRFAFAPGGRGAAGEFGRYALVALCAQGFSYAVFLTLAYAVPALPLTLALWTGAVLAAAAAYAGQRWFTFAPARPA